MKNKLLNLYGANRGISGRRFEVIVADGSAGLEDSVDVFLYDVIVDDAIEAEYWGGVAPEPFVKALRDITAGTIHLRVNSPGGSVFAARTMEQALRDHPARVIAHVDGYAASAATLLLMAADSVVASPGALLMIHNAWTYAIGSADELRTRADLLDKIDGTLVETYAVRSGQTTEQVKAWMNATTWFTAAEAKDAGLVDTVLEAQVKALTQWDVSAYGGAPRLRQPAPAKENSAKRVDAGALMRRFTTAALTTV